MPLPPGARLGMYQITDSLGAGGMGEVYRAHDPKLNRDVAIKVLPELFAADPDRLARFEREAQTLASLNHPNIAHIYGIIEDPAAIVMELVDGEDLARRLARGPIPIDEVLAMARQIAEALEAAHEHGIVHRDLKPANVQVRADGAVKVLDFGLAKAIDSGRAAGVLENSPTFTSPVHLGQEHVAPGTQMGVILGTAAYMAPEQARGKPIDKRADVWAFGCVLFEMLSGTRPFDGETVTDVLSAIVSREPDWSKLPAQTPTAVRALLRRSLEKDSRKRLRDIGEARLVLEEPVRLADTGAASDAARHRAPRWAVPLLAVTAGAFAIATAALAIRDHRPAAVTAPLTRYDIQAPVGSTLSIVFRPSVSVSADGSTIAFSATSEGVNRIYVRTRDATASHAVPGSDGGTNPALSPDGKWVVFFADGALRKAPVDGPPITIGQSRDVRGIAWAQDGTLVVAPDSAGPLMRLSADGSAPTPVTTLAAGERTHRLPDVLPGGKVALFTVGVLSQPDSYDNSNIDAVVIATGERRTILKGAAMARYCGAGRLLYSKGSALYAVAFDPERLSTSGGPVQIAEIAERDASTGAAHFDCSEDGTFVYIPGSAESDLRRLAWVDRSGTVQQVPLVGGHYQEASVSPEGSRAVLLNGASGSGDVWVYEFAGGAFSRLTFTGTNAGPIWSADGRTVYYTSFDPDGRRATIMRKPADGSREAESVRSVDGRAYLAWVDPGETLAVVDAINAANDRGDVYRVPFDKAKLVDGIVVTGTNEYASAVSPGGRWVAYQSDEDGRAEIYVRALDTGVRWQATYSGGEEPHWSVDGRELYYRIGNRLMVMPVAAGPTFHGGAARPIFDGLYNPGIESGRSYDVDPKTGRLLLVRQAQPPTLANVVRVALNWDGK